MFIWFSTNGGKCFIDSAFRGLNDDRHNNFLHLVSVWAIENIRSTSINSGRRTIEGIIEPKPLELVHYELAERMMFFLADRDDLRKLIAICYGELNWDIPWVVPEVEIEMGDEP